jgi:predicted DNA-binding protein (MmcQ/YjbR family)
VGSGRIRLGHAGYPSPMTPQEIIELARGLPEVSEEEPFGPGTPVFKVAGKVFAILQPASDPPQVTLKCEPSLALELRAQFPSVIEGYHVNKKHWNTVLLDGTVPSDEIRDMVGHSYRRVVGGLSKAAQRTLLEQL